EDWKRLSAEWRSELNDRIDRLTRLRNQLDGCIGCGCLSLGVCPLRNPWDKLGKEGPGPRLLDPMEYARPRVALDRSFELWLIALEGYKAGFDLGRWSALPLEVLYLTSPRWRIPDEKDCVSARCNYSHFVSGECACLGTRRARSSRSTCGIETEQQR